MQRLKTKVTSLAFSREDNYVDDSKETLDKIFKDYDCEVPIDDDEVGGMRWDWKRCRTTCMNKVQICNFVYFGKGNERKK